MKMTTKNIKKNNKKIIQKQKQKKLYVLDSF